MPPLVTPPPLTIWEQQLAGIVPLSALIEFIDVATKLHIFELTGTVPTWNWPVTPTGARLLLSDEDTTDSCCLDRIAHSMTLHCIDGRLGTYIPAARRPRRGCLCQPSPSTIWYPTTPRR
jgi:hypothetical protein